MKKPNAFVHMITWGTLSGLFLAMAYILLILNLSDTSAANLNLLELFLNPVLWRLSIYFGAFPGAILGFAAAINLWNIMRKVGQPLTEGKIRLRHTEIYVTTMALTSVLAFMLIAAMFSTMSLFFLVPPFVAPIVAAYAVHRYTSQLILWSKNIDTRKIKNEMRDSTRLQDQFSDDMPLHDMIEHTQSLSEKHS